jgi:hypothetical protein
VGDAATLITAIAGLITSLTGLVGAIVVLIRVSKRERRKAARGGVVAGLAKAAEDGVITADELRQIAEGEQS